MDVIVDVYKLPPQPPRWDAVGIFYTTFISAWTLLLGAGMAFLVANRRHPVVRVRGLTLSLASMLTLHPYFILGQLVYPVGPAIPVIACASAQYMVMGIYLPLGIALFHASNYRFLHVANLQKRFADYQAQRRSHYETPKSWSCRLRNMDTQRRTLMLIAAGTVVQVVLCTAMWLVCIKYHPSFGVKGTELRTRGGPLLLQTEELVRGWEWWPSIIWQLAWTWAVAPYLIYKSWDIKDTLGWRAQTIGCCVSGLHATPLFLAASYSTAFRPVNKYFPPSQWIHFSIMIFEIFTIFVPCWQVVQRQAAEKRAIASNEKWETESQLETGEKPSPPTWLMPSRPTSSMPKWGRAISSTCLDESLTDLFASGNKNPFTLHALDQVLAYSPNGLQNFSALRDFSGENVAFLSCVMDWKNSWPFDPAEVTHEARQRLFNAALEIYTNLVGPRDAEFPVNLSSAMLAKLEGMFEKPARIMCGEARWDAVAPFGGAEPLDIEKRAVRVYSTLAEISDRVLYVGELPGEDDFNADTFEEAYRHVRYLVFTNTWPKFVNEMRKAGRGSGETVRSETTGQTEQSDKTIKTVASWWSEKTLVKRASGYLKAVF